MNSIVRAWIAAWGLLLAASGQTVTILRQPESQEVLVGDSATFSVEARGEGPLRYQWSRGSTALRNETNAVLTLPRVNLGIAGLYRVQVRDAASQVISEAATLSVLSPPVIAIQPVDTAVAFRTLQRLTVSALGTAPLRYQWEHEGEPVPGQTNRQLALTITNLAALGGYRVVVSNIYGAATSSVARFTLLTNRVEFVTTNYAVTELAGPLSLAVRRTGSTNAIELPIRFSGTARADIDYQSPPAAEVGSQLSEGSLALRILDNPTANPPRELTVELTAGEAPDILIGANATATIRISDNDAPNAPALGLDAPIEQLIVLPDHRILVSGSFTTINGEFHPHLARLLPDFRLDPSFSPDSIVTANPLADVLVAEDQSLFVRGEFPTDGARSGLLRRLHPDGAEDPAYLPFERSVNDAVLGPLPTRLNHWALDGSGRLVVAGAILSRRPADEEVLRPAVRLYPDGSRDPVFAANLAVETDDEEALRVGLAGDGRIYLLTRSRVHLPDTPAARLRILDPNGVSTARFPLAVEFDGVPRSVSIDEEGRAWVAGEFGRCAGVAVPGWVRINPDGTMDTSFVPPVAGSNIVQQLALAKGTCLARTSAGELLVVTGQRFFPYTIIATGVTAFGLDPGGNLVYATLLPPNLHLLALPPFVTTLVGAGWEQLRRTVSEGAEEAHLWVWRTGDVSAAADLGYEVTGGSARRGIDFPQSSGVLHFDEGQNRAHLRFPLTAQNEIPNDDRTIELSLVALGTTRLYEPRQRCVITLEDDDTGLLAETFVSDPLPAPLENSLVSTQKITFGPRVDARRNAQVFYEWGWSSPPGVGGDYFASLWSGWIVPEETAEYQFATIADDGVRLAVGGEWIIEYWRPTSAALQESAVLSLEAGRPYFLVMQQFEQTGAAYAELLWRRAGAEEYHAVPRRVLRPGLPEDLRPSLKVSYAGYPSDQVRLGFISPGGRPLQLEMSPDGTTWSFLAEVVTPGETTPGSFSVVPTREFLPAGTRIRAVSVDGLAVTNRTPVPYVVRAVPSSAEWVEGQTNEIVIRLVANGEPPTEVTWLKDGLVVGSGVTLTVQGTNRAAAGSYQAIIQTPSGRLITPPGWVGLRTPPVIDTPLAPLARDAGTTVRWDAGVSGSNPLRFQWWKGDQLLPGATQAQLVLNRITAADAGSYRVVVDNAVGAITNGPADLRVVEPVGFVRQPIGAVLPVQTPVPLSLEAAVSGSGDVRYQWRLNGQDVPGATQPELQIPNATLASAGVYTLVVANEAGVITSATAEVRPDAPAVNGADDYANAIILSGNTGIITGNNRDATRSAGEPLHGGKPGGRSVWYRWTAPTSGRVTFSTRGSAIDTLLAAYTGSALNNLTEVASDDDTLSEGFFTSALVFNATRGTTYSLAIDSLGESAGNYALSWVFTPAAPLVPRLLEHPESQSRGPGERVELRVLAENAEEITWWFNGAPLANATGSPLVIAALEPRHVGTYVALIRGGGQTVASHEAVVELGTQPDVHSYDKPEALLGAGGPPAGGATLHGLAGGGGAPALLVSPGTPVHQSVNTRANTTQLGEQNHCGQITYRTGWLPLRTTADGSLVIRVVGSEVAPVAAVYDGFDRQTALGCLHDGQLVVSGVQAFRLYWLAFGSTNESGGSMEFEITTGSPPPLPQGSPTSLQLTLGQSLQLTPPALPGINPAPSYTWSLNGTNLPGPSTNQWNVPAVRAEDAGTYAVTLDNGIGRITYPVADVEVQAPLEIQPDSLTLTGQALSFAISGDAGQRVALEQTDTLNQWSATQEFWLAPGSRIAATPPTTVPSPGQGFVRARAVPLEAVPDLSFEDGSQGWQIRGGRLGQAYELGTSTNGVHWTPVLTNVVAETPYLHVVPANEPYTLRARPLP